MVDGSSSGCLCVRALNHIFIEFESHEYKYRSPLELESKTRNFETSSKKCRKCLNHELTNWWQVQVSPNIPKKKKKNGENFKMKRSSSKRRPQINVNPNNHKQTTVRGRKCKFDCRDTPSKIQRSLWPTTSYISASQI